MSEQESSTEVRAPFARAFIDGRSTAIDGVACSFGINSFPAVQVYFHGAEEGVAQMGAPDVAALVGNQQGKMFEARTPDNTVTMNDGKSQLEFRGFISSPNYDLGVGNVGLSTTLVDEAAQLANLDTTIYRFYDNVDNEGLNTLRGSVKIEANIGANLTSVLGAMVSRWRNFEADDESTGIASVIHANNAVPRAIWDSIAGSSGVEWPELVDFAPETSLGTSTGSYIADQIRHAYINAYGSFIPVMKHFQAQFNLIYVPGISAGDNGRFVSVEEAAVAEGKALSLKNVRIRINAGTNAITPLSHVVIRGPVINEVRMGVRAGNVLARWPETATSSGKVEELGLPQWFPSKINGAAKTFGRRDTDTSVKEYLNLGRYKESKITAESKLQELRDGPTRELLTRMARYFYIDLCLAPSQAVITTDLDFSIQPGERYTVSSPRGTLFTGFLAKAEHYLSSKPDNLQASTTLFFTYVEGNGFTLPNKE